jgi:hypothetical protein
MSAQFNNGLYRLQWSAPRPRLILASGPNHTGSIRLGSLFLTLPTRLLTGQTIIPAAG